MDEILSKCCNAPIHIGNYWSTCEECGRSVNPDDGEPYGAVAGLTNTGTTLCQGRQPNAPHRMGRHPKSADEIEYWG